MVVFVKTQKNLPEFLEANEVQTKRIAVAIKEGDEQTLIDAMQLGEKTLEEIGVVSEKAKEIIKKIEHAGGVAKILGGGGKTGGVGYLLCYSQSSKKKYIADNSWGRRDTIGEKTMTTSAPGKLMLFGEHAVVYGYPCIVTSLSERLFVSEGISSGDTRFIDAAIKAWGTQGQKLSAKSVFSGKYGFGSSSAVTVAALKYLRPEATNQELFDAALKIVLDIQGTGSGFDVAAAVFGGTLHYIKNKTIEPLVIKNMPLIVGYTGVKADTKTLIADVAAKRDKEPEKIDRIFQAIAKIVEEAKGKIVEKDWERVGRLMDFNQEYLRNLGVSSEKLEALISGCKKCWCVRS